MPPSDCPKCGGRMAEGFVADYQHRNVAPSSWVEGAPRRSLFRTAKFPKSAKHTVATYRCERCGYLESFAALTDPSNDG